MRIIEIACAKKITKRRIPALRSLHKSSFTSSKLRVSATLQALHFILLDKFLFCLANFSVTLVA